MPERKLLIFPISASGLNFNPQNTPCIPAVKICAFLELEKISSFRSGTSYTEKYSFILEEITAIVSEFEKVDFEERLINDLMSSSVSISFHSGKM